MNAENAFYRSVLGLLELLAFVAGGVAIYWGIDRTDTIFQQHAAFTLAGVAVLLAIAFQMIIIGSIVGEYVKRQLEPKEEE